MHARICYGGRNKDYRRDTACKPRRRLARTDGIFSPDGSLLYVKNSSFSPVENRYLYSLTAIGVLDGKVAWTFNVDSINAPAVNPDGAAVYIGCVYTSLQALDTSNGKVLWTFSSRQSVTALQTPPYVDLDALQASPAVSPDGKVVYEGGGSPTPDSGDHLLYALSATNGSELWRADTGYPMSRAPVVSPDGSAVYATNIGGEIHAYSTLDGSLLWEKDLLGSASGSVGFPEKYFASVSPDGKVVYVVDVVGTIFAFQASSGAQLWQAPLHDELSSPAVSSPHGSRVVVASTFSGSDDGGQFPNDEPDPAHYSVYALRASDGEKIWSAALGRGVQPGGWWAQGSWYSAAFSHDGAVVFIGGRDGQLYALDASNGEIMGTGSTEGKDVSAGPVVSPDGKSVFVSAADTIFIFPTEGATARRLRSSQTQLATSITSRGA